MSIITDDYIDEKVEEVTEILDDYDVMAHDAETIINIIENLGTMLIEAQKMGKRVTKGQDVKGSSATTT